MQVTSELLIVFVLLLVVVATQAFVSIERASDRKRQRRLLRSLFGAESIKSHEQGRFSRVA